MIRQLWAIAVGLIFLAVSAGSAKAQTESTVNRWVISIHGPGNVTNRANFANTTGPVCSPQ